MKIVQKILADAKKQLEQAEIPSYSLDAELLLSVCLKKNRQWLVSHQDDNIGEEKYSQFKTWLKRRLNREPIAYITGKKDFYGHEFFVTPDVLVPRPETEDLVDLALQLITTGENTRVIDVGTGSGCVGITLKLERPSWDMTVSDISSAALTVARQNAVNLASEVTITQSDILASFPVAQSFNLIVANLPYVDKSWTTSPELKHEPASALYADDGGLELIFKLIDKAPSHLVKNGHLLLEADPDQHAKIINRAKIVNLEHVSTLGYATAFKLA